MRCDTSETVEKARYTKVQDVICLGGEIEAKTAALYFDRVIPLMFSQCPKSLCPAFFEGHLPINNFLTKHGLTFMWEPASLPRAPSFEQFPNQGDYKAGLFIQRDGEVYYPSKKELPTADAQLGDLYVCNGNQFRSSLMKFLLVKQLGQFALLTPNSYMQTRAATMEDLTITLTRIPIISLRGASWEQITEFRKDGRNRHKLRRLRLFLFDNYVGKSREYVEDKLLLAIDDFEAAAQAHGFNLTTGTLDMVLNSKSLLGSAGLSVAALLLGSPITAGAMLVAGTAIEVGKIALQFATKMHAFKTLSHDHPLAYIIDARRKFGNDVKGR